MTEMKECPHRICRVGLWVVVGSKCLGDIRLDPVNGDGKVWFLDCQNCRDGTSPGISNTGAILGETMDR